MMVGGGGEELTEGTLQGLHAQLTLGRIYRGVGSPVLFRDKDSVVQNKINPAH